ncbi:hypothetical protein CkaCkLH20_09744 [Colletotrichum karsti]|uniref:Uncharacterized protein n=1 Tax=Colletotrichum karsti TaxID=1095194 RepID=A0A9P6LH55_9PEZI|nr:uncharacterized protein CkaCkLH20_09744 [Colletotrichum karsti]KAF9872881.1 hypothetical protein CkaCkLH20_09744 [Colletotrichum karsti]
MLANDAPTGKRKREETCVDLTVVIENDAVAHGTEFDPDDLPVGEGNNTRRPIEEELLEHFGYLSCEDKSCSRKMDELRCASRPYAQATARAAERVKAAATATADEDVESRR